MTCIIFNTKLCVYSKLPLVCISVVNQLLTKSCNLLSCFFRLNSYKCITDTLQELVNQSKAAPQSPSVPKKPGPPVLSSDPNMLSNEEAGHHVRDTVYFHSENALHLEVLHGGGGGIII